MHPFFAVIMKSNSNFAMLPPFNYNPASQSWQRFGFSGILKERLSKFLKLVEISIVITLNSIEDKQTFSIFNLHQEQVKKSFHNSLG